MKYSGRKWNIIKRLAGKRGCCPAADAVQGSLQLDNDPRPDSFSPILKTIFLGFRTLLCICQHPKRLAGRSWGGGVVGRCDAWRCSKGSLQAVTHPRLTPRHRSVATQPPPHQPTRQGRIKCRKLVFEIELQQDKLNLCPVQMWISYETQIYLWHNICMKSSLDIAKSQIFTGQYRQHGAKN